MPAALVGGMTRTAALLATLLLLLPGAAVAAKRTPPPEPANLTSAFVSAGFTDIDRLQVFELGGVVLIRGRAYDKATAEQAGRHATALGYTRVANLIQIMEAPDDRAIERSVERELTIYRALDGCKFSVASEKGVVRLAGKVQHDQQKDVAMQIVRNIEGVREVRAQLDRE